VLSLRVGSRGANRRTKVRAALESSEGTVFFA
jgi:hypothetical protein